MGRVSRVISAISTVILVFLCALLLIFVVFNLIGLRPMYVVSGSMEPAFYKGDLIIKSESDLLTAKEGNVVAFKAKWLDDKIVTHRLVSLSEGKMITKGDNNPQVDPEGSSDEIVGVIVAKIPYAGWLISPWTLRALSASAFLLIVVELFLNRRKHVTNAKAATPELRQIDSLNSASIASLLQR